MAAPLVIGIGHPDRGDDAVGRIVAARLREKVAGKIKVIETDGEAGKLIDLFTGEEHVIVVDAGLSGAPPGTVHQLDAVAAALPQPMFATSSHAIGLAESIELARTLGNLPASCVIYAIEAESFDMGEPLSDPVAASADRVVAEILAEINIGTDQAHA